jgi:hypothetical protein
MVAEARDYNFSAYTNRAMVANQVAVAQFVGLTSWFRNMSAFANNNDPTNAGRQIYDVFFSIGSSPVATVYKRFLSIFGKATGLFDEGKGGSTFMSAVVTVLDGLIAIYGKTQSILHYATAVSVAETLGTFTAIGNLMGSFFTGLSALDGGGNLIAANDPKASMTGTSLPYLAWHYYKWFGFTGSMDPNTEGLDGAEADRFAQVTLDSLDDFSRDRSTKPAWGFTFFYAPPLTYIDPTRFIPYQNGPLFLPVIHRGGTELKVTNAAGTGGATGPGGDGSTGVDCHGNPVTASSTSGSISVDYYSQLAPYTASACPGDSGIVTVGDAANPQGVYSFNGTAWINPSSVTNSTGSSGGRTTPTAGPQRGTTGSRTKKTWTALDASSWAGIDLIWITIPVIFIPIPLPIPFAPPWVPLSHGAAQSGKELDKPTVLAADNNFGVDATQAYGGALDHWTTRVSAEMRQNKAKPAGKTLDKVASLGGLTTYMDVKDHAAENLEGPPLVIEVEKRVTDMIKNPASGQFATSNGAPQGKMRVLSKAQVVFSRPTNDPTLDWFQRASDQPNQVELGSLYNPYWQPRLMANNFLEQYLSMELHRAGL